ncbi:MAG: hypothetical protein WAM13_18995 [Candidatus Sulfotelmatobacter sp.]
MGARYFRHFHFRHFRSALPADTVQARQDLLYTPKAGVLLVALALCGVAIREAGTAQTEGDAAAEAIANGSLKLRK